MKANHVLYIPAAANICSWHVCKKLMSYKSDILLLKYLILYLRPIHTATGQQYGTWWTQNVCTVPLQCCRTFRMMLWEQVERKKQIRQGSFASKSPMLLLLLTRVCVLEILCCIDTAHIMTCPIYFKWIPSWCRSPLLKGDLYMLWLSREITESQPHLSNQRVVVWWGAAGKSNRFVYSTLSLVSCIFTTSGLDDHNNTFGPY